MPDSNQHLWYTKPIFSTFELMEHLYGWRDSNSYWTGFKPDAIFQLGYTRISFELSDRIELTFYPYQGYVLNLYTMRAFIIVCIPKRNRTAIKNLGGSYSSVWTMGMLWWPLSESNQWRWDLQSHALPTELKGHLCLYPTRESNPENLVS